MIQEFGNARLFSLCYKGKILIEVQWLILRHLSQYILQGIMLPWPSLDFDRSLQLEIISLRCYAAIVVNRRWAYAGLGCEIPNMEDDKFLKTGSRWESCSKARFQDSLKCENGVFVRQWESCSEKFEAVISVLISAYNDWNGLASNAFVRTKTISCQGMSLKPSCIFLIFRRLIGLSIHRMDPSEFCYFWQK